ncbi:unnamed protein product [Tuber aestivum]|uniref:NodB homology domain-containing protein n=1 Tax=Tuber aestivum TaxID=59557 RepID=A0A292PSM4_9PEZI|nr:unnamed protein product [Tuber aestivum]
MPKEVTKLPLGGPKDKPPHLPPPPPGKINPLVMNRPNPGGVPYGQLIKSFEDPGMVALTFDDGPFKYTNRLLDTLKNSGSIRGTFFVNGKNTGDLNGQGMMDVPKRMMAEGHQISSHTSRKWLNSRTPSMELLARSQPTCAPPNFDCNGKCMKLMGKMGYHVVGENLDTHDWKNMTNMQASKDIVGKAVDGADSKKNNFIALAQDIHEATVDQSAKHMLDKFKAKGYDSSSNHTAVTVGECLGDAPEN